MLAEGCTDGSGDGLMLDVGLKLGGREGSSEGIMDGESVGIPDGFRVGKGEG